MGRQVHTGTVGKYTQGQLAVGRQMGRQVHTRTVLIIVSDFYGNALVWSHLSNVQCVHAV